MAVAFGFASPVTKRAVEGIYVELGLVRIHLCKPQGLRCPELTGGKLAAVAGAMGLSGARPQRTGGLDKGPTELLKMLGARCRAQFRASVAAVMAATSPVAWNSRPRRGYGLEVKSDQGRRGRRLGGSP